MRLLARLFLLVCLTLGPVQLAHAHAQLLATDPAQDTVLETAPPQIVLQFNEPVNPLAIRLIAADGTTRDLTQATVGGAETTVALPAGLDIGTHVLSWRVVSADGHPISGSLVFSIGVASTAAAEPTGDTSVSVILWGGKALLFLAMFIGIGGAAFRAIAPSPPLARRAALLFSAAGIVLAPLTLGLQGLDALGLPLVAFFNGDAWSAALSTSYWPTAIAAALAFACAVTALWLPPGGVASIIGLAPAALAALALALSGHASAASPQWLTRPAVFLHIAGILFWVGALLPLWTLLANPAEKSNPALAVFSKSIPFAVAPLLVSGLVLALVQMGPPGPNWLTPYGFILGAKLGLLALLFGLALWNRLWLTVPALAGDALARRRLRRSITWEMAVIVIILALVAGWRFTPPPRALPAPVAVETPLDVHLMDDITMAMVTMTPGTAGPVSLDIMLTDLEMAPIAAQAVSVIASSSALGIEPIRQDAHDLGGVWRVENISLPVSGTWQLEIEMRITRFQLVRLKGDIEIP